MTHYLYRFIAHRPDFATTMTPEERTIMQEHVAYWRTQTEAGHALLFGPVVDPEQSWGIAVVEADSAQHLAELRQDDPVITHDLGMVDVLPMPMTIVRNDAT